VANSDPRFDPNVFREAISFAMTMGAPPDPDARAVFVFSQGTRTYWKNGVQLTTTPRLDQDGRPLDPTIQVRAEPAVTKKQGPGADEVDCAIEFDIVNTEELPVGNLRPGRLTVTVLDTDYAKVEGCREVLISGDRYTFQYEPPSMGLFDVGVRQMIFYAVDEG
jgi:hypothetical protein